MEHRVGFRPPPSTSHSGLTSHGRATLSRDGTRRGNSAGWARRCRSRGQMRRRCDAPQPESHRAACGRRRRSGAVQRSDTAGGRPGIVRGGEEGRGADAVGMGRTALAACAALRSWGVTFARAHPHTPLTNTKRDQRHKQTAQEGRRTRCIHLLPIEGGVAGWADPRRKSDEGCRGNSGAVPASLRRMHLRRSWFALLFAPSSFPVE